MEHRTRFDRRLYLQRQSETQSPGPDKIICTSIVAKTRLLGIFLGQALRPVLLPMGAYLSSPITEKETFVGGKAGFLEYGGSSMQVSEVLCRPLNT